MGPSYTTFTCNHRVPEGVHVLFSVPHVCHALGWLGNPFAHPFRGYPPRRTPVERWDILKARCAGHWHLEQGHQEFLTQLATLGITLESISARGAAFHGAVIGWDPDRTILTAAERDSSSNTPGSLIWTRSDLSPRPTTPPGLCTDLELTLAVLSRCVSDLLIAHRTPSFTVDTLFAATFCTVDRRFAEVPVQPLPTDDWVCA
jgi:hypothetical protein